MVLHDRVLAVQREACETDKDEILSADACCAVGLLCHLSLRRIAFIFVEGRLMGSTARTDVVHNVG